MENWRESLKGEQMAKNIYGNTTRPDGSPLYEMSSVDRAKLDTIRDKWIENAYRTDTMSDNDKANATNALSVRYFEAKLEPPKNVLFACSPRDAVILAGIYFGAVYALQNKSKCVKAFGCDFSVAALKKAAGAVYSGRSSVDSAVDSAVASVAASVVASVTSVVASADADILERYLRNVVETAHQRQSWRWCRWYNYGNLRQWYLVRYDFYQHIAGVIEKNATLDALTKYAESAGPCYLFQDLAIVCDRPELFEQKTNGEFHDANGPVIRWRDGTSVYYWHGTIVPKRVIESPESYTRKEILAIRNSEIIRALAEKLGWNKFVEKLGAKVVSSQRILSDGEDGQTVELAYELLECEDRFDERQPKWLRMQSPVLKDGSEPWYVEPVDPGLETAQAARTWRTRRADGSWPTVAECNDGLMPDWTVRQGDLVFHRIGFEEAEALIDNGARRAQGANLVTGASTGHSHTLVFEHELYDLKDGRKLILRTGNTLCVTHDEHKTVTLDRVWTVQSVARQYDHEHGWINVED